MRLQATYAKQLGAFNTIIEQNAPFTVLWNLYLESLVDLCDVHHLSPFAVLGMLETTMEQHPFDIIDEPIALRMNLTDKAARFVEDNPKNITMALMAFTLRTGETSLTKLSYSGWRHQPYRQYPYRNHNQPQNQNHARRSIWMRS